MYKQAPQRSSRIFPAWVAPRAGMGGRASAMRRSSQFLRHLGLDPGSMQRRRDGCRIKPGMTKRQRTSPRSEEHTSELQSLMRISYAVFCLKNKKQKTKNVHN